MEATWNAEARMKDGGNGKMATVCFSIFYDVKFCFVLQPLDESTGLD
jgi:hypothetical protein